jgi:prolyl oligopeptidase
MNYPSAKKKDITDNYHGTIIKDPYRELEDPKNAETIDWVTKENKITQDFLNKIEKKEEIKQKITSLWNYEKRSLPLKEANKYFFLKNDGLQDQSVLYMQDTLESTPRVLLDPNTFSTNGTTALSTWSVSKNAKYIAYALSHKGSDWKEIKIKEIDGKELSETLHWAKFTDLSWNKESTGFFYTRYPQSGEYPIEEENSHNKIYFHKIGTSQDEDILIHEDSQDKDRHFDIEVTEDGNYLVLHSMKGTGATNKVAYKKINDKELTPIFEKEDFQYIFVENNKELFYFVTDNNASNRKVISYNVQTKEIKDLVPEFESKLQYCLFVDNNIFIVYLKDACSILKMFKENGEYIKEIDLPFIGNMNSMHGRKEDKEFFFTLSSYLYPSTIFRYNLEQDKLEEYYKTKVAFNQEAYITKQEFATSKDGTKVPLFITYKKGMELDGKNPTLLYGYGGFNVDKTPYFSPSIIAWLDFGGIFVDSVIRGGGEYGSKWHESGMLEKKQNVFDDFIASAEYLCEKKYTSPKHLGIQGGSNGGLLVGACMVQRPELYGAVVCQVPVIDMLRYHKFTVGKYWIQEYGCSENKEDFNYLIKYSPLHNIKEVSYPATLIRTADHDDRVVSAHAKKFAATLQEKNKGENPILLHIEMDAGHGAGKPTSKRIEEKADIYAFLLKTLDT